MRLFITGATGLIGRRLVLDRLERGDQVVLLSRDGQRAARMFAAGANRNINVVHGNPAAPGSWQQVVAGCDAVIHLAGAGLADRRWSAAYKNLLVSSRVDSTHQIIGAIEQSAPESRPRILVLGSAVGYYGDAGERELDEVALAGSDFLAQLTVAWEQQALRAEALDVRVVPLRSGVVLDERGGALKKMLTPFRLFMGGPMGSGRQFIPWIHWRDLMGLINLALEEGDLSGPLNAVAPQALRQREFAAALGHALHRPAWLAAPRFALRVALGEIAKHLTSSQRVVPAKAEQFGYIFLYPELQPALEALLRRQEPQPPASADTSIRVPLTGLMMNIGPAVRLSGNGAPAADAAVEAQPPAIPAAPIRLLAIDVDGTLLNSDGSISQGVIQACRAAERAGCVVVLATARPPRGMRSILQTLDINGPTINYNGAVIWNPLDGKAQFHEPLPADLARRIVTEAQAMDPHVVVGVEVLDHWFVSHIDRQFLPADGPDLAPEYVGPLDEILTGPVTKINLLGQPESIASLREMIREKFWQMRQVAVFLTDPRLIQITHPLVDKGIALQRIARKMGLAREQVMAIGDASNDLGMIEWAGFGVAVDNAYPAVKQLADAIVPSNDEQGVARAIQRYVLARRGTAR